MTRQLCALVFLGIFAISGLCASAQTGETKEKPPMYTYVAYWQIPRPQWADFAKQTASEEKMMEKALADGGIVAFGSDENLIHRPDAPTHDTWFSSMSMAGLMNMLDQIYKTGIPTSAVDIAATKHFDQIFVSRFYNWHSGSWKGVYTQAAMYKLKADAPDNAVETLSKNLFVPLMEKLLANGAIHEYEIDSEAIHTDVPGIFWVEYIAANSEGLDKVSAALREAQKTTPLIGPAFASMVDFNEHRDYLSRTDATYK